VFLVWTVETVIQVFQESQANPVKKVAQAQKVHKVNPVNQVWTDHQVCQVMTVHQVKKVMPLRSQPTFQLQATSVHPANEVNEVNQVYKVNRVHEVKSVRPVNVVQTVSQVNEVKKVNLCEVNEDHGVNQVPTLITATFHQLWLIFQLSVCPLRRVRKVSQAISVYEVFQV
jgi:hypothetical protein